MPIPRRGFGDPHLETLDGMIHFFFRNKIQLMYPLVKLVRRDDDLLEEGRETEKQQHRQRDRDRRKENKCLMRVQDEFDKLFICVSN